MLPFRLLSLPRRSLSTSASPKPFIHVLPRDLVVQSPTTPPHHVGAALTLLPPQEILRPGQQIQGINPVFIVGWLKSAEAGVTPGNFVGSREFEDFLHVVLAGNFQDDVDLKNTAAMQGEGWTHVVDWRNPPPFGRIPDPEDIFGSVNITKGHVVPGSYQRMPTHRIVSSYGLFQLGEHLSTCLLRDLRKLLARGG